ncbi:GNAT family N-acetyltransferase [Amphibacillus cookii]|uniref:GNAT family N-acetyltransferase n=1 Tax=Amphibacillus cookii TaxID=767787 RepID=UPI00195DAA44|nr:GNAT family N-acetyltransferase [Amphibacillus cookii]MBM7542208.1 ribosomal protein S18 acetylase RimI-like enzyme [Amphibacillus cookii]
MIIELNELKQTELDQIMTIWLTANREAHHFIDISYWESRVETVRKMIPTATLYIKKRDQNIVGFIGVSDGYIAGLFVDRSERGKGIGKALLDHAKARAQSLTLNVYQQNKQAVRFYLNNDFQIMDMQRNQETAVNEYTMKWKRSGQIESH